MLLVPKGYLPLSLAIVRLMETLSPPTGSPEHLLTPPWNARDTALEKLGQALGDGELIAILQSRSTGSRTPFKTEWWRTDDGYAALRSGGRMDDGYVFLREDDFARWLAGDAPTVAAESSAPPAAATTAMAVVGGSQGEALQAFLDRVRREAVAVLDREVREAIATREPRLPPPSLPPVQPLPDPLCPAEWTLKDWEKRRPTKWPEGQEDGPPSWVFREEQRAALRYTTDRVAEHAFVEFLDQWKRGDLELRGRRTDTPEGLVETVRPSLRCSPYMALYLRAGRFNPRPDAPPTQLPHYSEIMVYPVERPEPPPLVQPDPEAPLLEPESAGAAPPAAPVEAAVEESPAQSEDLQDATNEEIDAMLRRLWQRRGNPKRGLSRDKEALKQWKQALAEQGLTSTWGMVRARYSHADNKYLRGPPGR